MVSRGLADPRKASFMSLIRVIRLAETGHFLYWYMGNIAIVSDSPVVPRALADDLSMAAPLQGRLSVPLAPLPILREPLTPRF